MGFEKVGCSSSGGAKTLYG